MSTTFVPFCFALIFVSLAFTKAVHLYIHVRTVSPVAFVLFLPSLLLPDVFILCLSRLALQRRKGLAATAACVLACLFSIAMLSAASSQLSFFYETGSEIEWSLAVGYLGESDGLKILLSGLSITFAAGALIIVVAWLTKWYLYRIAGIFLAWLTAPIVYVWRTYGCLNRRRHLHSPIAYNSESDSDDNYDDDYNAKEDMGLIYGKSLKSPLEQKTSSTTLAAVILFAGLTTFLRPSHPYNMMSATLPITMLDIFASKPDICTEKAALALNRFPFPDLIGEAKWQSPHGHFKGWAPGANDFVRQYRETVPGWLPKDANPGFSKWSPKDASNETAADGSPECAGIAETDGIFYNPVSDPLKISNLDQDILSVLQQAFKKESVKIKHVALILLESHREELFPLQQGSDMHKIIMKSHGNSSADEINARLSQLFPVAERITGKSGNFRSRNGSTFDPAPMLEWNDTTRKGFGGINVEGAFTAASISFKSMAAIQCGAWPMPVDQFEEAETQSYQPCITQVLDLFNKVKENTTDSFLDQQWLPAFFQSITDGYDRQRMFLDKVGFEHVVTKSLLDEDARKNGEELEEINYFGYAETVLRPRLKEYLQRVQDENKRMFFSHFTSTSHHPWGVPESFSTAEYINTHGGNRWHQDFDSYLNSLRFTDAWLGEMLQMLDDFGMSEETLVVFVGDHGQAFKEDSSKTGTYENGHVSNFRVPITFRHPNLPRVQYKANATSISILPTILDLLINTGSLNSKDTSIASDLIHDYEGQSLIRPYKTNSEGRRAWNFGVINGGARMLSMTSADAPWRLVIPLDNKSEYRFTDLQNDPLELEPLETWSLESLLGYVKTKYGQDASQWVSEAEAISRWWGPERKRLWGYNP